MASDWDLGWDCGGNNIGGFVFSYLTGLGECLVKGVGMGVGGGLGWGVLMLGVRLDVDWGDLDVISVV